MRSAPRAGDGEVTKSFDRTRINLDGPEPCIRLWHGLHRLVVDRNYGLDDLEFPDVHVRASPLHPEQFGAPHPVAEVQVVERAVAVAADPFEEVPDLFRAPELKIRTRSSRKGDSDRDVLDDASLHLGINKRLGE